MDGSHTQEQCAKVTERTLKALYKKCETQGVDVSLTLLKPNMVLSGKSCATQADVEQVAEATVRCLKETVPEAVPGIVFLSGGQSDELATAHLSAMNALGSHPWQLSFSYGRALQAPALKAWGGKPDNRSHAQQAFLHRVLRSLKASGFLIGLSSLPFNALSIPSI